MPAIALCFVEIRSFGSDQLVGGRKRDVVEVVCHEITGAFPVTQLGEGELCWPNG